MRIVFIRHGYTHGNLEKRYIGSTDEPLCTEGIKRLKCRDDLRCHILFCSPMKRCIQTAEIIFPEQQICIDNDLRECDFGKFEGKNYKELSYNSDYQKWIDSGGMGGFPEGEIPHEFRSRCVTAFERIIKENDTAESAAFVVHGGTIMALFEKYAVPHKDYFSWNCENGHGYDCEWDGKKLEVMEII